MKPENAPSGGQEEHTLRDLAARWVIRIDRGLTDVERVEFEAWLKIDPRHWQAVSRSSAAWKDLTRIDPRVVHSITGPSERRVTWRRAALVGGIAAAIMVVISSSSDWWSFQAGRRVSHGESETAAAPGISSLKTKQLPDGTTVKLNIGAQISEEFTAGERRVRLVRGEAYFSVRKDPMRPFIVCAGDVLVQAVGTAFNVDLQSKSVEVLVTEGAVQVNPSVAATQVDGAGKAADSGPLAPASSLVAAGQRAVVATLSSPKGATVVVSDTLPAEVAQRLAWHDNLLRLGGSTLSDLAAEFTRLTGRRIVITDPTLALVRIGGRFRSDNLDDFVRVLSEHYGIVSEARDDGTLVLGKAPLAKKSTENPER